MSAFPTRKPMRGPAAQARTLTLGRTVLGRSMGTLFAIVMLGMTLGFALGQTGPAANAWLLGLASVIAGWYSSQVTSAAAKAQRVMATAIAPTSAMRAWRRGWLQAEALLWLVFAGICLLVIAWHDGLGDSAWSIPGAVLTAQALGAWAALASQGRVPQAWWAAPWIWAVAWIVYMRSEWNGTFAVAAWVDASLVLVGAASLFAAHRILEPLVRLSTRWMLPTDAKSGLRRYLQRWTSLNAAPRGYWWQSWYFVLYLSLYTVWQGPSGVGLLASPSLPMRLLWLFFIGIVCGGSLSVRELHWRRWLLPGAPLRNRIGSELFRSTATMYLIALPPLAALSALVAWRLGMSPHDLGVHALRGLMTIPELAFAIAAADALAAVLKGRMNKLVPWLVVGVVLLVGLALGGLVYASKAWPDSVAGHWPQAGAAYALTLLVVAAGLVVVANRLWRRRDLHDLLRHNAGAW